MPPIVFDQPVFGPTGSKTTSVEALEAAVQAVINGTWLQFHQMFGKSVIDTLNPSQVGNALAARLPGVMDEVVPEPGTTFIIRVISTNTGPATLSIELETPLALLDVDGTALAPGALIGGLRYLVRRTDGGGGPDYRLVVSDLDMWAQAAQGDTIPTLNQGGTASAMTARLSGRIAASLPRANGAVYRFRAPFTNTGPFTLSIEFETPVPVVDNDGLPAAASEVRAGRWYFMRYSTTGPQYRVLREITQRDWVAGTAGSGGGGGGGGAAEERAHIGAYLDGTTIRAVGDHDGVVADLGDLTAVSAVEGGRYASLIVNKPSIGPNSLVGGYPGYSLLAPCSPQLLHIVLGLGQSLMVGSQSAASLVTLAQPWPNDALMFDGSNIDVRMGLVTQGDAQVLDPATLTGFQPLVARIGAGSGERGETPMEGFVRRLTSLARQMNIQHRMLAICVGLGGTNYSNLKKGTQTYANMLAAVARAKVLAEARGWRVIVDGALVKHGESDSTNSNYANALAEWQDDVDTDVKAITGQQADVHFFVQQPSSFFSGIDSVLGMASADGALIHVTGADYPFRDAYSDDLVHMLGPGYELIGEQMALAWREVMWRPDGATSPVKIIAGARSGSTVTLGYVVPSPPLVLDTTTLGNPGQWGFRFFDGSTEIPITAATVTDTGAVDGVGQIELTLASTPSGAGRIDYALTLQSDPRTLGNVPRGCVRDSAPDRSQWDNRRLYRWAIHQRVALSSGSLSGLPGALPLALG